MIRVPTGMEDVFRDIFELLDLVPVLLRQHWQRHRVKHHKDKPSVPDASMKLLGDVIQYLLHVLLVNSKEVEQD